MDTDSKINKNDVLNNTINVQNKIKLNFYKGVLAGNIIDEPIPLMECIENSLMFSCDENSQYIPVL